MNGLTGYVAIFCTQRGYLLDAPSRTFPHKLPRDWGSYKVWGNAYSGPDAKVIALNIYNLDNSYTKRPCLVKQLSHHLD